MSILSNNEAHGDFTNVVVLDYKDLIAIGNAGQQTIAVIPAGGSVEIVQVDETVAFVGTTSLVLDIGTTTGDPDEFIDALDVDAMTAPVTNTGDLFTSGYSQVVSPVYSDTNVVLEVTDAAIASATAGKVTIGLRILNPRRFS
tara:strand:+ start:296 stop:724 length:429 start_codon:yes stop_codon:yes gene_type:complete